MEFEQLKKIPEQEWSEVSIRILSFVRKKYRNVLPRGLSEEDIIYAAIGDLLSGKRKYRPDLSLYENLRRIIRSNTCKDFKLLDNKKVKPMDEDCEEEAESSDFCEIPAEWEKGLIPLLEEDIKNDEELGLVCISIIDNGAVKPREISEDTGIPAERIYELKRKLGQRIGKIQDMLDKNREAGK